MSNFLRFAKFPTLILALTIALLSSNIGYAWQDNNMDNILGGANPQAPANPQANNANAPAAQGGGDAKKQDESNMLVWLFEALGWMYSLAFFALSVALVTLIVMNIIALRRDNVCPPDLVEGVEQHFAENNPRAAAELLRTDDSFLGQVVSAGLAKLDRGHPAAIEAMQEVGEEEIMKLEHSLGYIGLIGNISPMVGLLGTVDGMVAAFRVIAISGSTPNAADLANNISLALVTTLAGLIIAIPAISICNILKNRVQRLTLQIGIQSEQILERFMKP